jgi:hypothetical protein
MPAEPDQPVTELLRAAQAGMAEPSPQRVEDLFHRAVDLEPPRRAAFLNEHCAGDADLRAALEELLRLERRAQAAE